MAENGDSLADSLSQEPEFSFTAAESEEYEAEGPHEDSIDTTAEGDENVDDTELEAIKARVKEMEEEAEKLKEMQSEVEKQMNLSTSSSNNLNLSVEEKIEADARSVYVGNVDYGATAEELEAHFHGCGSINRVTILCDKYTQHPKGFAYVEFGDKDSVGTAQALDDSLFRGRQIKVSPKRTNRPGISSTNRPPRGGGGGGGGRFRRPRYNPYAPVTYPTTQYGSSYAPRRGGRFRPRRSAWFSPY